MPTKTRPHIAPLDCDHYYISKVLLESNLGYDPEKSTELPLSSLKIDSNVKRCESHKGSVLWHLTLSVSQKVSKAKNAPYNFCIELVGDFRVHPNFPEDKAQRLIEVNGSSILYGVAREMLRTLSCGGPFGGMLLPTMSFASHNDFLKPSKEDVSVPVPALK